VIKRTGVKAEEIDDFIVGSSIGVSEQWAYGGRTPVWLANLPETIAAKFVDQQCGSSMAAIHIGFMEIAMGYASLCPPGQRPLWVGDQREEKTFPPFDKGG